MCHIWSHLFSLHIYGSMSWSKKLLKTFTCLVQGGSQMLWKSISTLYDTLFWFNDQQYSGKYKYIFVLKWPINTRACMYIFLCLIDAMPVLFLGKNMWAPSLGIPSIRVTTWDISIRDEIWCPHWIGAGCWRSADLEADKVISAQQAQLSHVATCPPPKHTSYSVESDGKKFA